MKETESILGLRTRPSNDDTEIPRAEEDWRKKCQNAMEIFGGVSERGPAWRGTVRTERQAAGRQLHARKVRSVAWRGVSGTACRTRSAIDNARFEQVGFLDFPSTIFKNGLSLRRLHW